MRLRQTEIGDRKMPFREMVKAIQIAFEEYPHDAELQLMIALKSVMRHMGDKVTAQGRYRAAIWLAETCNEQQATPRTVDRKDPNDQPRDRSSCILCGGKGCYTCT